MLDLLRRIRKRHIPLLVVYACAGMAGMSAVANIFFRRDILSLPAEQFLALGIWISLPWSLKTALGALLDKFSLRKAGLVLGSLLLLAGTAANIDHASGQYLISVLGEFPALAIFGFLATLGFVTTDLVADTLAIDLAVEEGEIEYLQVLSRVVLSGAAVLAAAASGPLAANLAPHQVFTLELIFPIAILISTAYLKSGEVKINSAPHDSNVPLVGGVLLGTSSLVLALLGAPTVYLFAANMSIIAILIYVLVKYSNMSAEVVRTFIFSIVGIFLLRTLPGVGEGLMWFISGPMESGGLALDENFFGYLRVIGAVTALVALLALAKRLERGSVVASMSVLSVLMLVMKVPEILVYYGYAGSTLLLFDTALGAPLGGLTMIPLGILIAKHAPAAQRATYMGLMASFVNMALVGSDVLTQKLNQTYVVERSDFSQLGDLMLTSLGVSGILVASGVACLYLSRGRTN